MTVRLRAHHLLCMLTYVGKGYSPAFTANYDVIVGRIDRGEDILIVEGPDDICAPLLGDEDSHCLRESVVERDDRAAEAVAVLLCRTIGPGGRIRLNPDMLQTMRWAFRSSEGRRACMNCEWASLCSSVAEDGFSDVRLGVSLRVR
ncbi:DUF1284 domain-containing protein [Aurantimonas aggregata]|uniref:DUF1284 domain-containing protein n=1 Tax=Aurantimonas aggregata TaxID=2047720 RepID=A0A6L9MNN4_9HYPH|nr:DUF1284 domain-containing protein [Aurantimonas aggregata]NDV89467.1 DUF1284 domain-containing protein [Aurantimonas aggregata]